jgi:hypothetical protein
MASIHPKSKEFFDTLSSRIAATRSSSLVEDLGLSFCMNGSNQSRHYLRLGLCPSTKPPPFSLPINTPFALIAHMPPAGQFRPSISWAIVARGKKKDEGGLAG